MASKFEQLKERAIKNQSAYRLYQWKSRLLKEWRPAPRQMPLIYREQDLTPEYYARVKGNGTMELEHQIGRLTNFRRAINELRDLPGDFIEFGTYRGFSLLWIAYLAERAGIFNKKIVGLDGFVGLPYADGVWRQYAFVDASLSDCRRNVLGSRQLYDATKKNIIIERALFADHPRLKRLFSHFQLTQFSFIHIDCDVSQSFLEIADLLYQHNLIAPRAYLLFDDYGQNSDLSRHIDQVLASWSTRFHIKVDSQTRFTKNYYLATK